MKRRPPRADARPARPARPGRAGRAGRADARPARPPRADARPAQAISGSTQAKYKTARTPSLRHERKYRVRSMEQESVRKIRMSAKDWNKWEQAFFKAGMASVRAMAYRQKCTWSRAEFNESVEQIHESDRSQDYIDALAETSEIRMFDLLAREETKLIRVPITHD